MVAEMNGLMAILYKDFKRYKKNKTALLLFILMPVIMISFIGSVMGQVSPDAANILIGSLIVIISILPAVTNAIYFALEIQLGLLKDILAAPISKWEVILAKIISTSIQTILPPLILIAFAVLVGYITIKPFFVITAIVLTSFYLSALSLILAIKLKSMESFRFIAGFLTLFLLFFSNAIIPLSLMPKLLQPLILLNPITYSVDLIRYSINTFNEITPIMSLTALLITSVICFVICTIVFEREKFQ